MRVKAHNVFVHLGNVGIQASPLAAAAFSRSTAARNPHNNYYGVDIEPAPALLPANYRHLQYDFQEGLNTFPDNSVTQISSQLGLGYYLGNGTLAVPVLKRNPCLESHTISLLQSTAWRCFENSGAFDSAKITALLDYTTKCLALVFNKLAPGKSLRLIVCPLAAQIIDIVRPLTNLTLTRKAFCQASAIEHDSATDKTEIRDRSFLLKIVLNKNTN